MRRLSRLLAAIALVACSTYSLNEPPVPPTTIAFALDAPLCSSMLTVRLSIDKVIVATDTFATFGVKDTSSRKFPVQAGPHFVSANVIGGFVWPEKAITVRAGEAYLDTLPFYCS